MLAGELSIIGALTAGHFTRAHQKLARGPSPPPSRMKRWIVYQRERFPLAGHGPLVAAFSASAVSFSSLVRGRIEHARRRRLCWSPSSRRLLFFLQLRIADEFKDYEDDARYRPYRPVPRGLVSLRELAWVGVGAAAIQLALALALEPSLAWLLGITWLYLALMTREFFARAVAEATPDRLHDVAHADSAAGRSLRDRVRLVGRRPSSAATRLVSGFSSSAT